MAVFEKTPLFEEMSRYRRFICISCTAGKPCISAFCGERSQNCFYPCNKILGKQELAFFQKKF